jgi:ribosomal protein L13
VSLLIGFQVVGRVATVISQSLQGKDRPDYTPQSDGGDVVVVINADQAVFTGEKMKEKIYYSHSGKPGNLKESTPEQKKEMFGGAELVWKAVSGMLPKNKLRQVIQIRPSFSHVASSVSPACCIGAGALLQQIRRGCVNGQV